MERLRKKSILKLKNEPDLGIPCRIRNLRKCDLGGVIFGCKNKTIQECYSKQLFGLPESHFSYVKNIEPGLPLFLLNFSSRKLDGIFEAASFGQLNIDPFGWSDSGERSPFAAQKISRKEVQHLKDHYVSMDAGSISTLKQNIVINNDLGQGSGFHDSIFILGGFDGTSWLSSLDLYSPARDMIKPLRPMKFSRSYTSASKLIDKIYVLGGGDRNSVFDIVEAYDLRADKWIGQPSLNKRNGCLAAASLNNKIYAIGGGNYTECFSEVEVFDPNVGKWVYAQGMIQKRFSPAVATLNGALLVVGGYDGTNYLKSAERLDVRQPSWTNVASMSTCRGCHSLTVLGGKLYAVGGYDGSGIVKTMEVFEPKKGIWRVEDSMKEARAYAGVATIGETMFVMGGVNADESVSNSVEVYQEGKGWRSMGHKSIGKRSLFTAIVA